MFVSGRNRGDERRAGYEDVIISGWNVQTRTGTACKAKRQGDDSQRAGWGI